MSIRVLMITHNRPAYTELSLRALCDSMPEDGKVVVWDNASDQETRAVVEKFAGDPAIAEIVYHDRNEKLRTPTNWFWENYGDADLLGKVDDDCVVPKDWCEVFTRAHADLPMAGAIACWHFLPEDFDESNAPRKIETHGDHALMRNCWICGSGYLMKSRMVQELGPLREGESFSDYCIRGAVSGYIHGWYHPFLYQAHLDDPRLEDTSFRTNEDFERRTPLSAQTFGITSREDWIKRLRYSAQMLQRCSFDPSDYVTWQAKVKRKLWGLMGRKYVPAIRAK